MKPTRRGTKSSALSSLMRLDATDFVSSCGSTHLTALTSTPCARRLDGPAGFHRDRLSRFEHILKKRFPNGAASTADTGKLLGLRMGLHYERAVAEWCEEALDTLSADDIGANVTPIDGNKRETNR
jgi:hypothetical protein